jgi:hypothetical protein
MKKIKHLLGRKKQALPESAVGELEQAAENVPRITNETVAAHREDVLASARKYIYPLQHSKRKIVLISTTLFIAALVGFFSYCIVALYRQQSNSPFLYGVTQVIPFPVAKVGSDYVAYENYLFELRHYIHYYETQLKLDFNSEAGQQQLAEYKKRALDRVVDNAYVQQLAKKHGVSVSNRELDDQIAVVRNQNRLGASDKSFEDALQDNFGWTVGDFKRSLRQQMLAQKLVSKLDTETHQQAQAAMAELKAGADFAAVAKKYSDDAATKENGGEFGFAIDKTNRDLSAHTTDALFRMKPGEVSDIINVGYALEIVKHIDKQGDKIRAAHIQFNFKDINEYLNPVKDQQKARLYISP